MWKKLFNFFRPFTGHLLPFLYSQFFGRLNFYLNYISKYFSLFLRLFFPSIVLKDLEWSILDTFDSLTPSYQSTHTLFEVFTWFKKAEFKEIRIAEWENIIGKTNN